MTAIDDFPALVAAHRRELHAHCYRMTGSLADAEDLTQEVFLRAWRSRDRFRGQAAPRTWLYRIGTNACIDFLKHSQRRVRPTDSIGETLEREAWIDPYPDAADPADVVAGGESTDLYLTAALLHLPPRQRAAVIARDLLEFDADQTAAMLGCSVPAGNSLVQRGRAVLRRLVPRLDEPLAPRSGEHDAIVRAYVDAHQRGDVEALVSLLRADVRITMPPEAPCRGVAAARAFFEHLLGPDGPGGWRLLATSANGWPATANYLRTPDTTAHRALSIDVLRIEDGGIAAIHCFLGDAAFRAFGFDLALGDAAGQGGDLPMLGATVRQ